MLLACFSEAAFKKMIIGYGSFFGIVSWLPLYIGQRLFLPASKKIIN